MRLTDETPAGFAGVLVDESGRRARLLRRAGHAVSVLLLLWLGILALGALGLEPLGGGVPGLDSGAGRITAPPELPERITRAAEAAPRPAPSAAPLPAPAAAARPTATSRRAVAGAKPKRSTAKRLTLPSAGRKPGGSAAPHPPSRSASPNAATTPSRTGATPSGNTVGGKSATSPGQTKATTGRSTAPGQTKTTPQPQGNGKGQATTTAP
ncbi:MAG: hypothetical protein ABI950_11225 [Solirubrobacteraceae bacterium]